MGYLAGGLERNSKYSDIKNTLPPRSKNRSRGPYTSLSLKISKCGYGHTFHKIYRYVTEV